MTLGLPELISRQDQICNLAFSIGKSEIFNFSETIAASDLKVVRCRQLTEILHMFEDLYRFFTCKRNWYQFFTCKRNWYQFFTCKRNWYQFFTPQKNSLHVRNYQRILHMCEELVSILYMCEELVPIPHTREKVAPVLHRCDEYLPILHTSEMINMRNLSTNFRPQNLSKLAIRKFHIWQMWCICTNSSYGCEIYEMRNLRFNTALLGLTWLFMVSINSFSKWNAADCC